jgi:hypothetical protein
MDCITQRMSTIGEGSPNQAPGLPFSWGQSLEMVEWLTL